MLWTWRKLLWRTMSRGLCRRRFYHTTRRSVLPCTQMKLECTRSQIAVHYLVLRANCSLDWGMSRVDDDDDIRTNVVWTSSIALVWGGLEAYMQRKRSLWGEDVVDKNFVKLHTLAKHEWFLFIISWQKCSYVTWERHVLDHTSYIQDELSSSLLPPLFTQSSSFCDISSQIFSLVESAVMVVRENWLGMIFNENVSSGLESAFRHQSFKWEFRMLAWLGSFRPTTI